jgi:hypothetical protein
LNGSSTGRVRDPDVVDRLVEQRQAGLVQAGCTPLPACSRCMNVSSPWPAQRQDHVEAADPLVERHALILRHRAAARPG